MSRAATSSTAGDDTNCCALLGDLVDFWFHLLQVCTAADMLCHFGSLSAANQQYSTLALLSLLKKHPILSVEHEPADVRPKG
jgi:hypothetical protein